MAETIQHHPLMFTFRDMISGEGFLAGITCSGRALMLHEDDKWWMYGVRPGAIADSGDTAPEAFFHFRNRFKEVLFDIASDFKTFEEFKLGVENFFGERSATDEDEQRWEEAVKAIRSGQLTPEAPFSQLKRQAPEERPTGISVERLDGENKRFMPSDNVPDTCYALPLAA
ncbi:MAG: hypothetical protein A3H27_03410 [Acidobacteria bacterium RIFCSPLOWO2_02_FULL_59_13]|nr:MAG: hypothetical protein A3H27_03410 [Acidobacteria bacterium RIFCSPLOWO2_02_FULL_59_13]